MNNDLTSSIHAFIHDYTKREQRPPTIREIAAGCYCAPSTVLRHVGKMQRAGVIQRERLSKRGIVLVNGDGR